MPSRPASTWRISPSARPTWSSRADQAAIPHPRLGFYGVIDERMDLGLLDELAARAPTGSFVMVGPVVKIDPANLPRAPTSTSSAARL